MIELADDVNDTEDELDKETVQLSLNRAQATVVAMALRRLPWEDVNEVLVQLDKKASTLWGPKPSNSTKG